MSAYMCSERELTVLAAYAVKHCQHALSYETRREVDGNFELERGGYDRDARKLIDAIEAHAVHSLPGYNDAPWGIS